MLHLILYFPRNLKNVNPGTISLYLVFFYRNHFEVASDPFCLLINSSYIYILSLIFYIIYICQSIYFILILVFLIILSWWFRDLLRESSKKYEILLIIFFILFILFIFSEALLFISLFWTSFHSFSSILLISGFLLPDPCQLTFTNTFLLSCAAISLGNSFISLEISSSYLSFSFISLINSLIFISLQIIEFLFMALLINDSIYSCLFFFITGLHFSALFFFIQSWYYFYF